MATLYTLTGDCPRCGAPIYSVSEEAAMENVECHNAPPSAHFTCGCRLTMPAPLPDVDQDPGDSTEKADRLTLARGRPVVSEAASAERAD